MNISDLHGIDISSWQAGMSAASLNSVDFAIIKIADGRSKDWCFDTFYSQASIPVGAYVYSYATTEERAREEAQKAIQFAEGRSLPLGIYIDVEEQSQMQLRDSELTAVVKAFCDVIKAGGYRAGAYGSRGNLWGKVGPSYIGEDVIVWVAQWGGRPDMGDVWQFSASDHVDGYSGNVDGNKVLSERFGQLVAQSEPIPTPTPEPQPTTGNVTLNLPTLKQGDRGFYVKIMQTALIAKGFNCGWMGADGDFGANTKIALFKFKNGSDKDAVCDPVTWEKLLGE